MADMLSYPKPLICEEHLMSRRAVFLATVIFLTACGHPMQNALLLPTGLPPTSMQSVQTLSTPCSTNCLYVSNYNSDLSKWFQYAPPYSALSTPVFGRLYKEAGGIAVDNAYLVVNNGGAVGLPYYKITLYPQPVHSSTPASLSFALNGGPKEMSFDRYGQLWVPVQKSTSAQIEEFKAPFSSYSRPSLTITKDISPLPLIAITDSSGNLYVQQSVSNTTGGESQLLRFSPPYTGTPLVLNLNGSASGAAIHGTKLAVVTWSNPGCGCAQLFVYTLPLSSTSTPIVIPTGNGEPTSAVFDSSGNLYISYVPVPSTGGQARIDVYKTLTPSSVPSFSITNSLTQPEQVAIGP